MVGGVSRIGQKWTQGPARITVGRDTATGRHGAPRFNSMTPLFCYEAAMEPGANTECPLPLRFLVAFGLLLVLGLGWLGYALTRKRRRLPGRSI